MVRFSFDEAGDLGEYQTFRKQDQPLELVHLEFRGALKEAECSLRVHPGDREAQTRVDEFKQKLAGLDRKAPWINWDYPPEYLLWGPPHG
jgi:hypothetical protein